VRIDEVTGEVVPARIDRKSIREQTVVLGPHFKPRPFGPLHVDPAAKTPKPEIDSDQ
jgi:hypothetical protein